MLHRVSLPSRTALQEDRSLEGKTYNTARQVFSPEGTALASFSMHSTPTMCWRFSVYWILMFFGRRGWGGHRSQGCDMYKATWLLRVNIHTQSPN